MYPIYEIYEKQQFCYKMRIKIYRLLYNNISDPLLYWIISYLITEETYR